MGHTGPVEALRWVGDEDGYLELIDQRLLPGRLVWVRCTSIEELCIAIKGMVVRGAPAIGVSAAFGMVLALQGYRGRQATHALEVLEDAAGLLQQTRPTAVNLGWAVGNVLARARSVVRGHSGASVADLISAVFDQACRIRQQDIDMCRRIGHNGRELVWGCEGILTHCNAGALATAGQGTALSVLYEARRAGMKFQVYVDETRPLLQGARLTAWELARAGIEATVICDDMAGWLMKQGKVQAVITGADRIAANGDTANKIGTYGLAVLARRHKIPFYVAAPASTFDLSIPAGRHIPIEHRPAEEVASIGGQKFIPEGVGVWNPAFDVTDARLITAIVTDAGVIHRPSRRRIEALVGPVLSAKRPPRS